MVTNKLKLLFTLLYSLIFISYASAQTLDIIKLQLEWKHQFEFAGFYAAQEKGFYKDVGHDVEFIEYDNKMDITQEVLNGNANYGITW